MGLTLGIDTGGTYTDAVLVEHETGRVLVGAKALTTRNDLAQGIHAAIRAVFAKAAGEGVAVAGAGITLVALSTTLATNALAENHRGKVALVLVGYDPSLMRQYDFERDLPAEDVSYIAGGHDGLGNEVAVLDEAALRALVEARRGRVEAFAVSGYFGVRNPAHELRAKAIITELTGAPVTCGHELTSQLNAVRRATTTALNAHLILPLRELVTALERTLAANAIHAPLMLVKGDGSLVSAAWAAHRPIETILSGPAASVVGAWHLAGRRDVWIVDVGGTTTDIAALRGGWPLLNVDGARVGGWRTMVEAVNVHTTGLGGDSRVRVGSEGELLIGPRRAAPLSWLAGEHGAVKEYLRSLANHPPARWDEDLLDFMVLGRPANGRLDEHEAAILDRLAEEPRPVVELAARSRQGTLVRRRLSTLEERGLIRRAGFTPTDALHVLGDFCRWDAEAATSAATLFGRRLGLTAAEFSRLVVERFARRVAAELVTKLLEDEGVTPDWEREPTARALLERGLIGGGTRDLSCTFTLNKPLVAVGAPVAAYLPQVARQLNAELVIPPFAEVANAVGAVSGSIVLRSHVTISPLDGDGAVRAHLPAGPRDFRNLEAAVAYSQVALNEILAEEAQAAGAETVEVRVTREDRWAPVATGLDQEVYLGSDLLFVAAGRPSPARVA